MHKALTRVNSSESDCFADDAVEEAEETDTPLSSVSIGGRPLCSLGFADDIHLLGNSGEELQQLTQRPEETAAEYGMEISSEKKQNSRKHHHAKTTYQHTDELKNARRSGPILLLRVHTPKTEHQ